jgi:hypothetical protein
MQTALLRGELDAGIAISDNRREGIEQKSLVYQKRDISKRLSLMR